MDPKTVLRSPFFFQKAYLDIVHRSLAYSCVAMHLDAPCRVDSWSRELLRLVSK